MKLSLTTALTALAILGVPGTLGQQTSISGLSGTCTSTFIGFIMGDLADCMQIGGLMPVMQATDSSVVPPLKDYLGQLCAPSTPLCSNNTLTDAKRKVLNGCGPELQDPSSLPNVFITVFDHYPPIQKAACSKNETTGQYCVPETLEMMQRETGTVVSTKGLSGMLGGDRDAMANLTRALKTGNLCTGCVAGIYDAAKQVNASVTDSQTGRDLDSACGADFGSKTSGLATPSQTSSQGATEETSSSDSSSQAEKSNSDSAPAYHWALVSFLAVVVGAAVV